MQKSELRKTFLSKRDSLDKNTIALNSVNILNYITSSKEYLECENIFVYLSMGSEVITKGIIEKAWSDNKTVCVPVIKNGTMHFVKIKDFSKLEKTKFGYDVPRYENENDFIPSNENTVIIVPGLVFDKFGYRIGYGGGFYDKFLANSVYKISIAVSFDFQIIDRLNPDSYDIPVDTIVTESGFKTGGMNEV